LALLCVVSEVWWICKGWSKQLPPVRELYSLSTIYVSLAALTVPPGL